MGAGRTVEAADHVALDALKFEFFVRVREGAGEHLLAARPLFLDRGGNGGVLLLKFSAR